VFLAGTSAFFYGRKHADLSRFLLRRGIWLVLLELTVMRVAWTFNFDFANYEMAGVIWVIGWSMIIMAGLVKLSLKTVAIIGVVIIVAHNLLDPFLGEKLSVAAGSRFAWLWKILYLSFWAGWIQFGPHGPNLVVLYSIIPWVGVMAAGYAFGHVLTWEPKRRDRFCLMLGLGSCALFVILRGFNLYGDPRPWGAFAPETGQPLPAWLSFLNTTKYPASLLFLLMTLGPTIALIPALERARGAVARWITVFGRVPFFFYVLHIPLIHFLALVVSRIRLGWVDPWLFGNHPMGIPPASEWYVWSLPMLYAVWAIAIALLYFPCRWFVGVKATRSAGWLKYF
jgi:uncharacterized membrane protein